MTRAEWDLIKPFMVENILAGLRFGFEITDYDEVLMVMNNKKCVMHIASNHDGIHYYWTFNQSRTGSNHVAVDLSDPNSLRVLNDAIRNILVAINS